LVYCVKKNLATLLRMKKSNIASMSRTYDSPFSLSPWQPSSVKQISRGKESAADSIVNFKITKDRFIQQHKVLSYVFSESYVLWTYVVWTYLAY
jgi:hypothetical protein